MADVLKHHGIDLYSALQMKNLIIFEKHDLRLIRSASLCDLLSLESAMNNFLDPFQNSINTLVYFWFNPSIIFDLYLKTKKGTYAISYAHTSNQLQERWHCSFNSCVTSVASLLKNICNGSATKREVTCNNFLKLSEIYVTTEDDILKHFALSFSIEDFVGLKGVAALQQLLHLYRYIFIVRDLCCQLSLSKCLQDSGMEDLLEIAEKIENKDVEISLKMAIQMLDAVKEHLQLKNEKNLSNLKLLSAVQKNVGFLQYMGNRGYVGRSGRILFNKEYYRVSSQLQHEHCEEHDIILNQLLACFDYVEPFLCRKTNLEQLMKAISCLENVKNGIKQLVAVNKSIKLVKYWFEVSHFI